LNVGGNYCPEITNFTYPLLKRYAEKIDAEFYIIKERKFPDFPVVYEKLQIRELAKKQKCDWAIYIDSDAIVHPDFFDPTEHLTKDIVAHNGNDFAPNRWKVDDVFRKDGRFIGSCNWFTIASDWCLDLWAPLDIPLEKALANIYPTVNEQRSVITKEHLIDDYTLSRNIAKYGFHYTPINQLVKKIDPQGEYLWHEYCFPVPEKIAIMKQVLKKWSLVD
jgi:hypothetical protein